MRKNIITAILLILTATEITQAKILLVKWKDADFYNEAVKGLENAGIKDYDLVDCKGDKECASEALKKSESYDAVCVLGESPLKTAVSENLKKPVFYGMVYNPSLIAGDKKNITGVSLNIAFSKQLETIKSIIPGATSVGVLYSRESLLKGLEKEAQERGMTIKKTKAENEKDVNERILSIKDVSVVLMLSDPIISSSGVISALMLQAQKIKSPLFVSSDKLVKSGALFGLAPDYFENGRNLGIMIKHYLESKNIDEPADMESGDLYINTKTAKDLKIDIEESVLQKAKETFK
ncbi:MAG: ABC transporter substrate binding protein [bacterium]|nr:ABC transporter substrate binding protein [bacterium]